MEQFEIINGECKVPVGVDTIETETFNGRTDLIEITIPGTVRFIAENAFKGCSSLKKVEFLDNDKLLIDVNAFEACTSLESINLPEGIKEIGRNMFLDCSSLEEIVIPDGVKQIGLHAFSGCSSLSRVSLPESLERIENDEETFDGCNLDEITLPPANTNYSVEGNCLLSADGKTLIRGCNRSDIPENVLEIGPNAFSGCKSLDKIIIPDSVKYIGRNAFEGCTSLKNIVIPKTVEKIYKYAFSGCSSLSVITIDKERTEFDPYNSFRGCPNAKRDGLYNDAKDKLATRIKAVEKKIKDTL